MKNRKRPRGITTWALYAFLLKRCFYVHWSHLCVANYPKAKAKVLNNRDISKYLGKKLRKLYVNHKKKW